ncbi:diguanylate cyclase [Deinococcus arcticus]|uniref:GGDEF domain-containing protein n=1 Tax=Deinococcus arcticus TaxID=2136176 RepID=A0A2T3W459_9DEIO|nr:diguanylate cyclase [Deinococcus arcticus]PTA66639.1 GGDEF domain-containing protein [Deinococcus arcticus]
MPINALLINLALLVAGLFVVSLTYVQVRVTEGWAWLAARYLMAVATGFILIVNTIPLAPGLLYDFRTVPVALASRRNGWLAGLLVALPLGAYRWLLGGPGKIPACINLVLVALLAGWGRPAFTRAPETRSAPLYARWWEALQIFALANVMTFVAFTLAGRSVVEALGVYTIYTLLSTVGMIAGHLVVQTRLKALDSAATLGQLAFTDGLTGALNRRQFDLDLPQAGPASYLLLLDLDHFKRVNDVHGHEAGDRVLAAMAGVVRRSVRPSDRVYRLGGEEFAVLLHECQPEAAPVVAERVRANIEGQLATLAAVPMPVTVSGGLVAARGPAPLVAADAQLYAAKAAGRNRIHG